MNLKRFLPVAVCAAMLVAGGCTNDKTEQQKELRSEGIDKLAEGDYDGAKEDFSDAIKLSKYRVGDMEIDLSYYLAAADYMRDDYTAAVETYTNIITYDENAADAYFLRGSVYFDMGKPDKALADYKKASKVCGDNYEMYIEIYRNLEALGYTDEAVTYLNAALEIEGKDGDSYYYRGRIYQYLGQDEVAETAFVKAIDGGNDEAGIYLARIYLDRGEDETARDLISKYTDRKSYTSEERVLTGQLLISLGEYEKALENYNAALKEVDDDDENIQQLLEGQIAAMEFTGDFKGAYEAAKEYVSRFPADGRMMDELQFLETRM